MLIRMLPGIAVCLLLGLALSLLGEVPIPGGQSIPYVGAGPIAASTPGVATPTPTAVTGFGPAERKPVRRLPLSVRPVSYTHGETAARSDSTVRSAAILSAVPVVPALAVPEIRFPGGAAERGRAAADSASRFGSGLALANLAASPPVALSDCPAPEPPTAKYLEDLPAKGIYAWGRAERFTEKQKEYAYGFSHFGHKGDVFRVGFMKDWSVDVTVGLSVDIIDSELRSLREFDTRRSEIDAYVLNAHYHATLWDRYLLQAGVFLGRAETKGTGEIGYIFVDTLTEEKHKSALYGASATVKMPLIYGNDIKITPEIGLRYARLRGDSYQIRSRSSSLNPFFVPETKSSSLTAPVSVEVKRDFEQFWGVITPRVNLGMIAELDDGGTGLRTFNAATAAAVMQDPVTRTPADLVHDKGHTSFMQIGVGLDILTHGGWDLRADYHRQWAEKYTKSVFKLELGKCF